MANLTPENRAVNKKLPEIQNLMLFLERTGTQVSEIAKECGKSERTINNYIWQNIPISGQVLRVLCLKFGISIDWLLSGKGAMLVDDKQNQATGQPVSDSQQVSNPRAERICQFVNEFLASASNDEQIWLEMQLKIHIPQYSRFLERKNDT
jgi:plasmid maintenance system antidote protein VapI